jgi:hypothetical protein
MASDWYYMLSGAVVGPVPDSTLVELARRGVIKPDTQLRNGESGTWFFAVDAAGLLDIGFTPPQKTASVARRNTSEPLAIEAAPTIFSEGQPEDLHFQEGSVDVTSERFMVGGAVYPMRTIQAVKFRQVATETRRVVPRMPMEGCLGTFGLFFVCIGFALLTISILSASAAVAGTLVLAGLALLLLSAAIPPRRPKRTSAYAYYYQVILITASKELQPLSSNDAEFIHRVVEAIERVIAARKT